MNDVADGYLYYSNQQQLSEMLNEESLRMLNDRLKQYVSSCETFTKYNPKDLEKIVSLYLKKYSKGLNHLILNLIPDQPNVLLLVSDFKDEMAKPLNPRLIFRFLRITNEEDWKVINDVLTVFCRNLISEDREVIVRINLTKMLRTLTVIKYDFTQLGYIEPFHDDMSHVHTTLVEDEDEDEEEEDGDGETEGPETDDKEQKKKGKKKTEYDIATSSVVKDFYVRTILQSAKSIYARELSDTPIVSFRDLNTEDFYEKIAKNELTIEGSVVGHLLEEMFPNPHKTRLAKMDKIILSTVKELFTPKFIEDINKKSTHPITNMIRILAKRYPVENSNSSIVWRCFSIYIDKNVDIRTFRPFAKMLF